MIIQFTCEWINHEIIQVSHDNANYCSFVFTTNFHLNQSLNDSWQLLMSNHLFSSRNSIVSSKWKRRKNISKAQHVRFKENEEQKNNILRSMYMIYDLNYLFMLSLFSYKYIFLFHLQMIDSSLYFNPHP